VGEDVAEHLGIAVRQAARVDIVSGVLEALEVSGAYTCDTKLVELVVLTNAGKGDAVVDLRDFAERLRCVLGDDDDAIVVPNRD
jgi:hypothetical protein